MEEKETKDNGELRNSMTDELTGFVYYDAASGDCNHDPGPFDVVNKRSLRGPGIGFNYTKPGKFSINMSVSWRTTDQALTDGGARKPRVVLHVQKNLYARSYLWQARNDPATAARPPRRHPPPPPQPHCPRFGP